MAILAFFLLFSLAWAKDPLVDLGYSKYRGLSGPNGVDQFLGMRYAAAPVGNLRFAAPQDPVNTTEIQSATQVRLARTRSQHQEG